MPRQQHASVRGTSQSIRQQPKFEGVEIDRYLASLDNQLESMLMTYIRLYRQYLETSAAQSNTMLYLKEQLSHQARMICLHYKHGIRVLMMIHGNTLPAPYNGAFLEEANYFTAYLVWLEMDGFGLSPDFITHLRVVVKRNGLDWPMVKKT